MKHPGTGRTSVQSRCSASLNSDNAVGTVKLTLNGQASASDATIRHPSDLDTRHLLPDSEGTGTQQAMVHGAQEAKTETETVVEPDGVADDLGRESTAVVVGNVARHRPTLTTPSRRSCGERVVHQPQHVVHVDGLGQIRGYTGGKQALLLRWTRVCTDHPLLRDELGGNVIRARGACRGSGPSELGLIVGVPGGIVEHRRT